MILRGWVATALIILLVATVGAAVVLQKQHWESSAQSQRELQEREQTLAGLQTELESLTQARDEARAALQASEQALVAFEAERAALVGARDQAESDRLALEAELQRMDDARVLAEAEAARLEAELANATAATVTADETDERLASIGRTMGALIDERNRLARSVEATERQITALEREIADQRQALAERDARLRQLQADLDAVTSDRQAALERVEADHRQSLAERDARLRQLQADLDTVTSDRQAALEQVEADHRQALAERDARLRQLQADLDTVTSDRQAALEQVEASVALTAGPTEAPAEAASSATPASAPVPSPADNADVQQLEARIAELESLLAEAPANVAPMSTAPEAAGSAQPEEPIREMPLAEPATIAAAAGSEQDRQLAVRTAQLQSTRQQLQRARVELEETRSLLGVREAVIAAREARLASMSERQRSLEQRYRETRYQLELQQNLQSDQAATINALEQRLQAEAEAMVALRNELDLLDEEREELVSITETGTTVIKLPNQLVFGSGSTRIDADGVAALQALTRALESFPDHTISVEGHSDSVPIRDEFRYKFPSNWELSAARASAAVQVLTELGIEPERLRAVGLADTRPLVEEVDATTRRKNRRIEILLYPGDLRLSEASVADAQTAP